MILYEFEGKNILKEAGIVVPPSQLIQNSDDPVTIKPPLVLKAQVLSGKRADVGGIIMVDDEAELKEELAKLFGKVINKEKVEKVLIEEKAQIEKEYYLSISYDTDVRAPVLTYSEAGGTGIEQREVQKFTLNALHPTENLPDILDKDVLEKLIKVFFSSDCLLLEINPLIKTKTGEWLALDAKVKLDDVAFARHKDWIFSPRSAPGHNPTQREIEAKKIDEGDYRGVAGSAFFELTEGDIAVMSSGGGASLTAMDALLREGGKPANYTEYSGNPPREKVLKLTKVVLSKPNLHGLWVVGAVANFTDIYETLSGIIEGLREIEKDLNTKFDFPIVIRRGGPKDKEAFEMLRQVKDFDLHLYGEETSITESAKIMMKLAKEYEQKNG